MSAIRSSPPASQANAGAALTSDDAIDMSSAWLRHAPLLLLLLAVASLIAQALAISAMKAQPRYDEVAYIAVARSYHRLGGVVATIRCHLSGLCQEDNRSPAFELLLQALATDSPRFYAVAKLFTLGTTLALLLAGFLTARRHFGVRLAVGVVVLWCLMPSVGELSSRLLPDVFFASLILICVVAIASCQKKGVPAWIGTGALIGVAYLTKGNGHLLFAALFCVGLHQYGRTFIRRPGPYAAVAAFLVVTAFLIRRNVIVFHSPFHNFNERLLWLDNWEETWATLRDPAKSSLGLGFLLRRHSLWDILIRVIKGLGHTIGVVVYTAGLGVASLKQPEDPMTAAIAVPRSITGTVVILFGLLGLRRRLKTPLRPYALAVIYTLFWFVVAFASGQAGAGEIGVRYVLPLVVVLTPFALDFGFDVAWPWLRSRLTSEQGRRSRARSATANAVALLVVAVLLATKLATFGASATHNPFAFVSVPAAWAKTSAWFAAHLRPGERYAFPYTSLYSTFDQPYPEPDQRWIYLYRMAPEIMHRDLDRGLPSSIDASLVGPPGPIDKVFIDANDALLASYQDKFSPARDAQGPIAFLGWPRCFADGDQPSRFLVYCRPAGP